MNKEHILQEIRRTTKQNGGKPLGRSRFFREIGIKESDWLGRYWARWSEAVREAGFAPNQLQGSYDIGTLMEKYIELARELGRLPVPSEMRLKTRNDPSFPNDKTFHDRLGSKPNLVGRVLEYCRNRSGCEDIVRLCEKYNSSKREVFEETKPKDEQIGFVYIIKSGRFYKIGRTNASGRRERELALQLPEKTSTVHVIRTDDPVGIEAYWHKRFETKRKNGEWFELSSADITAFRRRKFM